MATAKMMAGPGAPRREDSRAGRMRSMRKGSTVAMEQAHCSALEEVSTLKRKMNSVWSRAAGMVRKQEGKSFSLETTTQLTVDQQVEVTLWVKRVA